MQAFVIPAPIPEREPTNANIWHPTCPAANPRLKELYINIGAFAIMIKSQNAKFTMNIFDGVCKVLALKNKIISLGFVHK